MPEKKQSSDNPFGKGFEEAVASPFIKWEKVGQAPKGILIDVYESTDPNGNPQKVYILQDEDGEEFRVGSRGKIFDLTMKKVVFGQWVGFSYAEDIPSKKKGNSAFKLVKVYPGQVDEEWQTKNNELTKPDDDIDINEIVK